MKHRLPTEPELLDRAAAFARENSALVQRALQLRALCSTAAEKRLLAEIVRSLGSLWWSYARNAARRVKYARTRARRAKPEEDRGSRRTALPGEQADARRRRRAAERP